VCYSPHPKAAASHGAIEQNAQILIADGIEADEAFGTLLEFACCDISAWNEQSIM
jgi:hypothetical protein